MLEHDTPSRHDCPGCGDHRIAHLMDAGAVPVNSCLQMPDAESALAIPKGRLLLDYCQTCGYIFNSAFDPALAEYSARYEETQGYSGVFREFHHMLAVRLIERFGLQRRTVLEIGCGKGEFLGLLAELGGNQCIGFDPGYDPGRGPADDPRIQIFQTLYDARHAHVRADFVCCKMTLEHIAEPMRLLALIRRSQAPGTGVFFMVPDARRIIQTGAFEDIYYEHCAYYTDESLRTLFEGAGFDVQAVQAFYGQQYLGIFAHVARPGAGASSDRLARKCSVPLDIQGFAGRHGARIAEWRIRCRQWLAGDKRIVLWGGGSKAVAFLSALPELAGRVVVVDINPHRQGMYLPGTTCRIQAPEGLRAVQPDVVIVMNAIYRDEIQTAMHAFGMEGAQLLSL